MSRRLETQTQNGIKIPEIDTKRGLIKKTPRGSPSLNPHLLQSVEVRGVAHSNPLCSSTELSGKGSRNGSFYTLNRTFNPSATEGLRGIRLHETPLSPRASVEEQVLKMKRSPACLDLTSLASASNDCCTSSSKRIRSSEDAATPTVGVEEDVCRLARKLGALMGQDAQTFQTESESPPQSFDLKCLASSDLDFASVIYAVGTSRKSAPRRVVTSVTSVFLV
jgi:hypothetical protein